MLKDEHYGIFLDHGMPACNSVIYWL